MKLETKCRRRAVEALLGMTFDMSSAPEIEQAMDRDEGAVERVTVDMGTGEILAVEPAGELPAPAGAELSGHLINELQESRAAKEEIGEGGFLNGYCQTCGTETIGDEYGHFYCPNCLQKEEPEEAEYREIEDDTDGNVYAHTGGGAGGQGAEGAEDGQPGGVSSYEVVEGEAEEEDGANTPAQSYCAQHECFYLYGESCSGLCGRG